MISESFVVENNRLLKLLTVLEFYLVFERPGEGWRCVDAHERKGVEGGQDADDQGQFQVALESKKRIFNSNFWS